MHYLGIDLGSSSVKVCLADANGKEIASAKAPIDGEMEIISTSSGFAEQNPEDWWAMLTHGIKQLKEQGHNLANVKAIGIAYQMHGLVAMNDSFIPLRPAIIWCDSRAIPLGEKAFQEIGEEKALKKLLNSPGNFTAAKLAWVKNNEPDIYNKIAFIGLPGDWLAARLTGQLNATVSGLSEGIFIDHSTGQISNDVLNAFSIDKNFIKQPGESFRRFGKVLPTWCDEFGFNADAEVCYVAGDQPNNAFSLSAINPGEVAINAGTSGVLYAVSETPVVDMQQRVNTFAHVTHTTNKPSFGVLACVNGTGIQYSWLRHMLANNGDLSFIDLNNLAKTAPPGCDGLHVFSFGNGAERILNNRNIGASFTNINFHKHGPQHLIRAAQEGIAFSLVYCIEIFKEIGIEIKVLKAGSANLFNSPLFRQIVADTSGIPVEVINADGALGAARGAMVGSQAIDIKTIGSEMIQTVARVEPSENTQLYRQIYNEWLGELQHQLQ